MDKHAKMLKVLDVAATLLRVWIAPNGAHGIPSTQNARERLIKALVTDLMHACEALLKD